TFGHTILQDDLTNVEPDVILSDLDTGVSNLSYLSGAFNQDKRDSYLLPSSGFNFSASYKISSEVIGSDANFATVGSRLSFLLPMPRFERFSLANRSQAGASWGFSGTEEIPISQRFYLGGQNSVRGFRENSLGPRGSQGHVIGGDLLVANNLEFRYQINDSFLIHTFLDAGTVYLMDETVSLSDIRTSTGLGFRYLSPIGPIGFDLGKP
ncbi:MAG: outer membrane protein assembly factor, partial [Bdellovibrionales bacterium]|nr:outer membrane protein assembly factor [Bdellovibrionales bacterium]